jgi:hypothetical protein
MRSEFFKFEIVPICVGWRLFNAESPRGGNPEPLNLGKDVSVDRVQRNQYYNVI